ncbi:hypothetical protein [Thiocapsa marina]|uniref:Oligosaccharide repeat unit polymerase n=1 Tax=Thiocapsa marina 5811 TaxID=768671 RepID=F9U6B1_9GAMM|nr:hypothetical protein [Thiocapsa marina]EGV20684.1 hypothetical protein ThimaDRAFT_0462 [Thiocapsa marina 5811]
MFDVILTLIVCTVIAIILHSISISGRNPFEPIYYVLIGYIGVFVLQGFQGRMVLPYIYDTEFLSYSLFLAWMSLVLFYLGYRSGFARRVPLRLPKAPDWQPGALVRYGTILFFIGVVSQVIFISQSGGAEQFYSQARGAGNHAGSTAYIYVAKTLLYIALPILFIEAARGSLSAPIRFSVYFVTAVLFVYQVYIGQRSGVFLMGVSILAWWYLPRMVINQIPMGRILLIIASILILVGFTALFRTEFFVGSDLDRTKQFFEQELADQLREMMVTGLLGGGGTDQFSHGNELSGYLQTLNVVPDRVGHDFGAAYLRYSYHWIPRMVWPDKPVVADSMRELIDAAPALISGTNTMLGSYYYSLGLIGLVLGSLVTGVVFGALEYWRKLYPRCDSILLVYLVLFAYGRTVVMAGGILAGLDTLLPFVILPIGIAFWILRRDERRKRRWLRTRVPGGLQGRHL